VINKILAYLKVMSISGLFLPPDRYGDTFQYLGTGGKGGTGEKEVIERKEAVRHILGILKKLRVRWQRTPKQLPGWRDSL
jgi:hypothetical protein